MAQSRRHLTLLAAALPALCATMFAQTAVPDATTTEGRRIASQAAAAPFSVYSTDAAYQQFAIEYRSYDQMTQEDRRIAANAESSIAEHAHYAGLEFNAGSWNYEQILCPAMPRHVFLHFRRDGGKGDVSMFTASIPRGEQGTVRIIPIQMRGYSLFSPVPINGLTLAAFNRIRAEEDPDISLIHNFVGTGLCYAALAGGHPKLGMISSAPEKEKYPVALSSSMQVREDGGLLSFSDVSPAARPVEWKMTFDRRGKLIKAKRDEAPLISGLWYLHPDDPSKSGKVRVISQQPKILRVDSMNAPRREIVYPATVDPAAAPSVTAPAPVFVAPSTPAAPATPEPATVTPAAPSAPAPPLPSRPGAMPEPIPMPAAPESPATPPTAAPQPATPFVDAPPAATPPQENAPPPPAPTAPGEAAPSAPPQTVPEGTATPAPPPQ